MFPPIGQMNRKLAFPSCSRRFTTALLTTTLLFSAGLIGIFVAEDRTLAALQSCTASPAQDPHQPEGWFLYFADEFNCDEVPAHWSVQGAMSAAAYQPPANGYVQVNSGALQVGVVGQDVSFPYLYLVDDSATTYDIPFTERRIDWIPNSGDYRLALRVRFRIESVDDHRISLYADGHTPSYAGPLYYVGADNNRAMEAWRGIILGVDRGNHIVDLGDHGYIDAYAEWIIVTIDHLESEDRLVLSVDGKPLLTTALSTFKHYPYAATRPDVFYLGSLAYLERATGWIDIDLDWLRVYAPSTTPPAQPGIQQAIAEEASTPNDAPNIYSSQLPPGPFANTPHWFEDFDGDSRAMPSNWRLLLDNDPRNSQTNVDASHAVISNNGDATGVPVWGIYDDLRQFVPPAGRGAARYLDQRSTVEESASARALLADPPTYVDWRPNHGNIRYAWKAKQSAEGYGVEVSNGGHVPYFTGAMFYTLLDTTTAGRGQFIFPTCQEKYFWRLELLPAYAHLGNMETIVTADYINGTAFFYVDNELIGWWPESDCSLNWYLHGENATTPDLLFFGNPAEDKPGRWSEVSVDWFVTFPGLDGPQLVDGWLPPEDEIVLNWNPVAAFENVEYLTATISFSATEAMQWTARLSDQAEWIQVSPMTGTVPALTPPHAERTAVLPPVATTLTVTVTRPITYDILSTVLTLNAETSTGRSVVPVSVQIRSVFTETNQPYQHYLPQIDGILP